MSETQFGDRAVFQGVDWTLSIASAVAAVPLLLFWPTVRERLRVRESMPRIREAFLVLSVQLVLTVQLACLWLFVAAWTRPDRVDMDVLQSNVQADTAGTPARVERLVRRMF